MLYHSTRSTLSAVDSAQAVLEGLAPDGGLYMPENLPEFDWKACLQGTSMDMSTMILSALLPDIPDMENLVRKDEATAKNFLIGTLGISEERFRVVMEASAGIEAGKVIRTEPTAGSIISEGQEVVLYVSSGPDVITEPVPHVENLSIDKAIAILRAAGFKNIINEPVPSSKEKDTVVHQSVPANQRVDVNTVITLQYSTGNSGTTGDNTLPTIPEPDPELKFKVVTVEIPEDADFLEKYIVSIWYDGELIDEQEVMEGAKSVQFEVSGKGQMTFTVDFNGLDRQQIEVDFDE
jgi:hypothetical protein